MAAYANSFTAVGAGPELSVRKGGVISYAVSGTFAATFALQRDYGQGWVDVVTGTAAASGTEVALDGDARYRMICRAFTSGTMVTSVTEGLRPKVARLVLPAAIGKAGATAGWVVAAAADLSLATVPASQTASTLVVPVTGLNVGDKIVGMYCTGQIESGGNAVTLDMSLRKMTAAAADVSDAAVAAITQVSVTADTILSSANTRKDEFSEEVGADESFYLLLAATTLGSTDVALQSITVEIERA